MTEKYTPGPWRVFICDDGKQWTGWPLSVFAVNDEDKSIVRPGGFYPYEWDAAMSQREAVANARLIAAAPDLLRELQDVLEWALVEKAPLREQEINSIRAAICKATGEA